MGELILHRWQREALAMFKQDKKLIANVSTGCGKSILGIEAIKYIREVSPESNILVVAPKIVILETVWMKELAKFGFGPNVVGLYYGYAHEFSKITLTTIASIPRLDMSIFDFILCDEVHNMMSTNLIKLLRHDFEWKLGLSASIQNVSQKHWKLLGYFDNNTYEYGMKEAINDGIINKFNFYSVGVTIDDPEVKTKYEYLDLQLKQILKGNGGFEKIMRLPIDNPVKIMMLQMFNQRNDLINNYVKKIAVVTDIITNNFGKKILLFSQYTKITRALYWALKETNSKSEIIDSHIKQSLRDKFLKDFEENKYDVLLSSRIFEEGYNLPRIDCAIFLSSNSTSRQMIQRLGRILRKKEHVSEAYYVYCKDTFEEDYAKRAKEFVQEVAEQVIEVNY